MLLTATSKRKYWLLFLSGCLAASFVALPAQAEDPKTPADKPADPLPTPATEKPPAAGRGEPGALLKAARERLDQLGLTDDQKKTIDAAYENAKEEIKKVAKSDPQERRQALTKAMTDLREKVGGVLTDEQKAKLGQLRAGAGDQVERLRGALEKLDLTSEQKEKLKPVLEDAKKKFTELREQLQGGDRAAMREKLKTLMDETRDKLKEILTSEQAEKLKTAMESVRPGAAAGGPPTPKPADK